MDTRCLPIAIATEFSFIYVRTKGFEIRHIGLLGDTTYVVLGGVWVA